MKPYSVYDAEFKPYGQVQHGFPTEELLVWNTCTVRCLCKALPVQLG